MIDRLRSVLGAVSFHRGLALGALVGSAIAGSTIWARIREARQQQPVDGEATRTNPEPAGNATSADAGGSATTTD